MFMQNGDGYFPTPGREALLDNLPVGNYVVAKSMAGMFFQRVPKFTSEGKTYGELQRYADRIMSTFLDRERATGALLAGEKGSGKSLLARLIAIDGYQASIPTILVNAPWEGDEFSSLLATVTQPAIVLMDEFEKVYNSNQQEGVLTLLDGTMTSKKLFILTVNNKYAVDSHMRNRPGRLFYSLDFDGLEGSFVREYCEDNLENQDHTDAVVRVSGMFEKFNFDMLKALVEEMNRYKEDPFDALKLLNAKPMGEDHSGTQYQVTVWSPTGVEGRVEEKQSNTPLTERGGAHHHWVNFPGDDDDEDDERNNILGNGILIKSTDVQKLDAEKGVFEFLTEEGYRVLYKKLPPPSYDLRNLVY